MTVTSVNSLTVGDDQLKMQRGSACAVSRQSSSTNALSIDASIAEPRLRQFMLFCTL